MTLFHPTTIVCTIMCGAVIFNEIKNHIAFKKLSPEKQNNFKCIKELNFATQNLLTILQGLSTITRKAIKLGEKIANAEKIDNLQAEINNGEWKDVEKKLLNDLLFLRTNIIKINNGEYKDFTTLNNELKIIRYNHSWELGEVKREESEDKLSTEKLKNTSTLIHSPVKDTITPEAQKELEKLQPEEKSFLGITKSELVDYPNEYYLK
jgi:hypothetical protein